MYKKHKYMIERTLDDAWIPLDEANTDYQQYLAWLAEGNEPEIIESEPTE